MDWYKFSIKVKIAYRILTQKYTNWAIISIDKKDLGPLLEDKSYGIYITTHGLHEYAFYKLIKSVSAQKDNVDMLLDRAKFQAESELYTDEKNK